MYLFSNNFCLFIRLLVMTKLSNCYLHQGNYKTIFIDEYCEISNFGCKRFGLSVLVYHLAYLITSSSISDQYHLYKRMCYVIVSGFKLFLSILGITGLHLSPKLVGHPKI